MSELRRWLDDAPPTEVRRLLQVGQWARPSESALEQALHAVRSGATARASDFPPPAPRDRALGPRAKWALIGALLAGSALVVGQLSSDKSANDAELPAPVEPAPVTTPTPVVPEPKAVAHAPSEQQAAPDLPSAAATAAANRVNPPEPLAEPKHSPSVTTTTSVAPAKASAPATSRAHVCKPAVVEQIQMLEQAKTKIRAGSGAEALAILDRYDAFGTGRCFVPESLKHRMDAYQQTGNQAAARRTASAIKKYYPDTAQARAAAAVLKE